MMLHFIQDERCDRAARADAFVRKLKSRLSSGSSLRQDEPLGRRTTLRVGGRADVFVQPCCIEDLACVLRACREDRMPLFTIGRGSNLLVRDGGFRGVIISLDHVAFSVVETIAGGLRAGAGAKLKQVAIDARNANLGGFEFLEGIPGTIGGALRMNAGAMGCCIFDLVTSVQFMDTGGEVITRRGRDMDAKYRSCEFFERHVALQAELKGCGGSRAEIEQRMAEFSRKRWSSQPAAPSAGCMFKNPEQAPAGKIIDKLGLKGARLGGAMISREHGNFLVTEGLATARDVIGLMCLVRQKVREATGIELESEVQVIGEDLEEPSVIQAGDEVRSA